MASFSESMLWVGDRVGDAGANPIEIPTGQTATVTWPATPRQRANAILTLNDDGGLVDTNDLTVTQDSTGFTAVNNTVGTLFVRFLCIFELPSVSDGGRIATSDVAVA